jgi:SAM-dependent methyltransferase
MCAEFRLNVRPSDDRFDQWLQALERRHFLDLTFPQVSGALRALSSTYVERRRKLQEGAALEGAGKRAAFALFYGPLHYMLIREIVHALPDARRGSTRLVDLGCGTGASGAAWASACTRPPSVLGIDRHPWAVAEASRTYREFGLEGGAKQGDLTAAPLPNTPASSILAAFAVNEIRDELREPFLQKLLARAGKGDQVLVVEPLAGFVAPWWDRWQAAVDAAGGRADEWRFRVDLPPIVAKLDRAAGLNHRELTGRSLWLGQA